MYKHLFLAAVISCYAAKALAQPTLSAANFNPAIGDAFNTHICDTTGVTPGLGGAYITWNFDSLITTSIDTGIVTACAATPHCSLFPGSTYAIVSHATHLIPYYIENSDSISQNGYYIAADTNAVYSNPIKQFTYPFSYGASFSDPYAGTITLGAITANETGTITVTYDGYGTLILPSGVDTNVLRVHTVQLFVDSASLFGFPTVQTFQLETYAWYKANYHSPLMTILNTTQIGGSYTNKAVSYSPKQTATSTQITTRVENSLQLYPNPATNDLNIEYTSANNEEVRISLYDLLGKEVVVITDRFMQGRQNINYNTSTLPKGLYLLRVRSGGETITRKIEIQ